MLENLKIALKRQKKLLLIFFLTIFLPSVSLSIFGIRAIRNEKFRLARQEEAELRRAADYLKTQIHTRLKDIDSTLQNLSQFPSFSDRNYSAIGGLLETRLASNPLVEQIFLVYRNEAPLFPLLQDTAKAAIPATAAFFSDAQIQKLKEAEECEFKQENYRKAISLYEEIFSNSKDKNCQVQVLNSIGRCFTKLKNSKEAIKIYLRICEEYPESITPSGLPLSLIARLQILDCYKNSGDYENRLRSSSALYRDILQDSWRLNEDQLRTYSSMLEEIIADAMSKKLADSVSDKYPREFELLKKMQQKKIEQWQVITALEKDVIPELRKKLLEPGIDRLQPLHHSKSIDERSFLISAAMIPDKTGTNSMGIIGVKIKNESLEDQTLKTIIEEIPSSENMRLAISDLSGRVLFGRKDSSAGVSAVTEFFEDNFPPWRIEIFRSQPESSSVVDIRKSFYFWTILTLVVILIFGAAIIVRTIAHEMEVLKIKSDFVSAVSHEFKTPLTSIKALIERLKEGKVKDEVKMEQYFSLISQDADKLTRLVKNILDFSKIEEGKKEYEFAETDVTQLLRLQVETFRKGKFQKEIEMHTQIEEGIPPLYVDQEALSQAINNLLDNALKFSPGRKEIFVNLKRDKENAIIEVEDKGIGIPQDELGKIFEKFYQGRNALRQSARGTGLGLTLVKHTVEAHGGRISVKSKVGQGSTFSLIFPINRKEL
jgi:signal transduction histidine kinase/tetratricopeptide (TPR) repeat protein